MSTYVVQLSEASSYDQQAPQSGLDPRYPEALPLPRAWDQAQPPAQPGTSSSQESRPWWEVSTCEQLRPSNCLCSALPVGVGQGGSM